MICYLPFTEIAKHPLDIVSQTLGPITVYGPSSTMATGQMRAWQEQGLLDLHVPSKIDDRQFMETLQAYKNWAQLHDGHISDMIQFYHANQGRPPLMDENAPSQIRTQIRRQGDDTDKGADPIYQAALFLALAQEYDQHQKRLGQEMGAVAEMERAMYATMGSGDGTQDVMAGQADGPMGMPSQDPGMHMTGQRIQAWAHIACHDAMPDWAYVTPSAAVFEHLKGLSAEVVELAVWYLSPRSGSEDLKRQRQAAMREISSAKNLDTVSLNADLCGHCTDDAVPLVLAGMSGSLFDAILPDHHEQTLQPQGNGPKFQDWGNTVIGLVGCQGGV